MAEQEFTLLSASHRPTILHSTYKKFYPPINVINSTQLNSIVFCSPISAFTSLIINSWYHETSHVYLITRVANLPWIRKKQIISLPGVTVFSLFVRCTVRMKKSLFYCLESTLTIRDCVTQCDIVRYKSLLIERAPAGHWFPSMEWLMQWNTIYSTSRCIRLSLQSL